MNLISQSQVKLHRQYHLVLTLHIKIDLFIYVLLHCCCHRKRKFVFLWLGNWLGGVPLSSSLNPRCTGTCWTFKAIDVQRLLLVHSALEHIQCFNCCSSKIVNIKSWSRYWHRQSPFNDKITSLYYDCL